MDYQYSFPDHFEWEYQDYNIKIFGFFVYQDEPEQ